MISDGQRLIAVYPYRDSDITKITLETTSILLLSCGVPGLDLNLARLAGEKAVSYLRQFCIK